MADLWKRYTNEIYKGMHYLAAWPPSKRVQVGDVVVMEDRSPDRQMSASDLGIETPVLRGAQVRSRGWATEGALTVGPAVAASGPVHPGVVAGAELEVKFNAKHAILLRAERSREDSIDQMDRLKQEILRMHAEGKWRREWVVVTHVIHAKTLMVLVSSASGAVARLRGSGSLGVDPSALAEGNGEVALLSASGMVYEESGVEDATPFYLAIRVQDRLLRRPITTRIGKRGRVRGAASSVEVVDVAF